ncbi:hypothetical protein BDM02DRAFT_3119621 [Thelephora ganbajun]|uniref:Uncharacterized protein n=1 Tax=Thelephora ganbajun TaxID=370292 RepID=A0ACB6Z8A1_THEGA|nr:hypothetical protein BDM02DRAFT_3119621 [Thelephora ganbajun]
MNVAPSTTPTSSDFVKARYASTTVTSIVVAVSVTVTLFYLAGLYLAARHWARPQEYPSVGLQRSISSMYLLLALTGIAEASISTWILAQYDYNDNSALEARVTLFYGCWMTLIAGCCSFLSLHPKSSRTPFTWSVLRLIWVYIMFPLWVSVTGVLGALLPCNAVFIAYCRQLKALLGISIAQW